MQRKGSKTPTEVKADGQHWCTVNMLKNNGGKEKVLKA
jgi:hypothetical protein